jgi:hypothetical protein
MTDTHHTEHATEAGAVTPELLARLSATLWLPHDMDQAAREARLEAAQAMLADIAPDGGMEGMLAVQMVATHEAAMECLRRAMQGDQPPDGGDRNLKHAEKLLALYTRQMEVLGRHRARDQKRAGPQDRPEQPPPEIRRMPRKIRNVIVSPEGLGARP